MSGLVAGEFIAGVLFPVSDQVKTPHKKTRSLTGFFVLVVDVWWSLGDICCLSLLGRLIAC